MQAIQKAVGPKGCITDPGRLEPHLTERRGLWRGQCDLAVSPASTGEVALVVSLCSGAGVPVVPVDIIDAGIEAFTRIKVVQDLPPGDKMGIRDLNEFHLHERPRISISRRARIRPAGKTASAKGTAR